MDTKQLHAALSKLYTEDESRIVFWNDPEGEFEGELDKLNLDDVTLVRLDQTGSLATKVRVEYNEPETKFLLYAPEPEPELSKDALLDIRLYSKSFSADRSSIILDELGLTRHQLKEHLTLRKKFFGSKERLEKLKLIVSADDNEQDLDLKMLSVVTKSEQPELSHVIRTLFQPMTEQEDFDLDTCPDAWVQIEKFELEKPFWEMVTAKFGYRDDDPTLKKLIIRLFMSEFAHQLGTATPAAIHNQQLDSNGTHNAVVFLGHWRDSGKHASGYNLVADAVASYTRVDEHVANLTLEQLKQATTFQKVDQRVLRLLFERLDEMKESVDASEIRAIVNARQSEHWISSGSIDESKRELRKAAFEAVAIAADFFALKGRYKNGFDTENAEAMYGLYVEELYKFDQLYRTFCFNADIAESQGLDTLKPLRNEIENAYKNWFLEQVSMEWGRYVDGGLLSNWRLKDIPNEYQFYDKHVRPRQQAAGTKRSFVVISDAFRYEAAVDLTKEMNGKYRLQAELSTQLSVLPSYTALGMASLLPHQKLEYTQRGDVLADGISTSGTDNRTSVLEKVDGFAIQSTDLLKLKQNEGRELIEGKEVVYIYHNEIDTRGENAATESDTFKATRDAIDGLANIIRYVVNNLGATYVVVTADHGFLFTESQPTETDKSKLANKPAGTVKAKKRYLIGHDLPEYEEAWHGSAKETAQCDGGMEFWIPKGSNRFHFIAGARFIHGGAMLQEVVVPVITVRLAKNKDERAATKAKHVGFSVLGQRHKITTGTHNFTLVQTDAVSDRIKPLTVKAAIYDGEAPVSSVETVSFTSASESLDDRKQTLKLTLKTQEFDKNKQYKLRFRDASTDFDVESYDVTIDRVISDDFDF